MPIAAKRTTGKRTVKVETRTWMFPYCSGCIRHMAVSASLLPWIVLIAALGIGVMLFVANPILSVVVGSGGSGLGIWLAFHKRATVRSLRSPTCAANGPAVSYLGWHRTVHEFEMASTLFATQFASANERKLVNPDAELLEAAAIPPAPPPAPPRDRQRNPPPGTTAPAPHPTGAGSSAPPPTPPPMPPADSRPAATPSPPPFAPPEKSSPPREVARPEALAGVATYRWLPKGGVMRVAGRDVAGGMVYFGRSMPCAGGYRQVEPALVDPSLPVASGASDREGAGMPYWPSYSEIGPASRAAYLEWLTGGRSSQEFGIGYVYLFFYGLERRVLSEAHQSTEARAEIPTIIAEVERLRGVYGSNRGFDRYSRAFLDVATILHDPSMELALGAAAPEMRPGELGARLRFDLARFAASGQPIPADWALAWAVGHPETHLRTPATRCTAELRALFRARYTDRTGGGIRVTPNRTKLVIRYQPASATFGGEVALRMGDLPDVTALTAPLHALRDLVEECTTDLEPFSRWRGKNPSIPLGPTATETRGGEEETPLK